MSAFPWDVLALAVVLAVNRLAVPATYARPAAFWTIQALNLVLTGAVAVYGLPGLTDFPTVGWLVAGLLLFHVIQNVALRGNALQARARERAERERLAKLRALEAPPAEPPGG